MVIKLSRLYSLTTDKSYDPGLKGKKGNTQLTPLRPPRLSNLRQLELQPHRAKEIAMTDHKTGTREEGRAPGLELLEAEKELTRRSDELARRRQQLPWVRIDKEYRFETDEGSASLADLFRGRSQLLVYHFMFGPDYTAGCP